MLCDGAAVMTLPDGRQVYMPDPSTWPDVGADEMPWEEDVEQAALVGPSQNLSDKTPVIDELLAAWNEQHGLSGGGTEGGTEAGTESGDGPSVDGPGSCACSTEDENPGGLGGLALAGLLGLGWRLLGRGRRVREKSVPE
jgi:MYXO-CTERM domain-containing protein